jgi:hypothetical protein
MKPTSEQTRKGVLSAVPFLPEDLLNGKSFFRFNNAQPADAGATAHATAVDPLTAYGCVDWFIYPDPKTGHA